MCKLEKGITIKAGQVEITVTDFVEALFREYYGVLFSMEVEPGENCYTITGVESDLQLVVDGKLSTMEERPFLERFAVNVEADYQRMIALQDGA